MQDPNTFISAGWDFAGESGNGVEDIWNICDGMNYPQFVWEIPLGEFSCTDGVTMDDWALFSIWWDASSCTELNDWCEGADIDFSGTVDWADALVFFENWLSGI